MALKFKCPSCNENIGIRYLSVGEVAECKKCRSQVVIPQDAVTISDDEAEALFKSTLDHSTGENRVPNEVEIESRPSPSQMPLPSSSNHKRIKVAGKEYELASRGTRWSCAFLDSIITLFVVGIIAWVLLLVVSFFEYEDIGESNIWIALLMSLFIFGCFFKDGAKNGQSLAKKLGSIRIINSRNGNPCNYRRSFVRNLLAFLPFDALFIFGEKRQRLGDKMAGTLVVKYRSSDVVHQESRASKTAAVLAILFVSSYGLMYFFDEDYETGEIIASDEGEKIVRSIDGQIQVTVPSDWVWQPELHDEATLKVGNSWKELYLIVLPENKSDFISMNLERYSQITKESLMSNLESPETSAPIKLIIDNNKAIQYQIRGISEGVKVGFLHTSIEDSRNYYQILAWTLRSRFRSKKELLQQVIQSFQATPPQSLWKIE